MCVGRKERPEKRNRSPQALLFGPIKTNSAALTTSIAQENPRKGRCAEQREMCVCGLDCVSKIFVSVYVSFAGERQ